MPQYWRDDRLHVIVLCIDREIAIRESPEHPTGHARCNYSARAVRQHYTWWVRADDFCGYWHGRMGERLTDSRQEP
jgi:hypothetical protein